MDASLRVASMRSRKSERISQRTSSFVVKLVTLVEQLLGATRKPAMAGAPNDGVPAAEVTYVNLSWQCLFHGRVRRQPDIETCWCDCVLPSAAPRIPVRYYGVLASAFAHHGEVGATATLTHVQQTADGSCARADALRSGSSLRPPAVTLAVFSLSRCDAM